MLRTRAPEHDPTSRDACPGHSRLGTHGTVNDYWYGCRCPDARADKMRYDKKRGAGVLPDRQVDPTGTVRRLRAMAAQGWTTEAIAAQPEMTGWSASLISNTRAGCRPGRIARVKADAVTSLTNRIGTTDGGDHRIRAVAHRNHWAPLIYWLDADIDDPNAQSDLDHSRTDDAQVIGEDVVWLASPAGGSLTPEAIAHRLRVPLDVVDLRLKQHARSAPHARLTDQDIHDMRDRFLTEVLTGHLTRRQLAAQYGVTWHFLLDAVTGRCRPHMQLPDLIADSPRRRPRTKRTTTSPTPTTADDGVGHTGGPTACLQRPCLPAATAAGGGGATGGTC